MVPSLCRDKAEASFAEASFNVKNIKRLLPSRSQRISAAFLEAKRNLELLSILI
jgi:hypothetical protein